MDLTAFRPCEVAPPGRWEHHIRPLDRGHRVVVPEVRRLSSFDGRRVAARVVSGRWELGPVGRAAHASVVLDERDRLVVPSGVRHQLGIDRSVVVSVAVDVSCIAVWSSRTLDALLEAGE